MKVRFLQNLGLIAFGLALGLLILEGGLRLAGYMLIRQQEKANESSLQGEGEYVILCLGESTTGLGGENSYPRQLEKVLRKRLPEMNFAVVNKGIPGGMSDVVLASLADNLEIYRPQMVISMLGVNDNQSTMVHASPGRSGLWSRLGGFKTVKLARSLSSHINYALGKDKKSQPGGLRADPRLLPDSQQAAKREEDKHRAAVARDPLDKVELMRWGAFLIDDDSYLEAREVYRNVLALDPENYEARVGLIYSYQNSMATNNEEKEAPRRALTEAIVINPDDCRAYTAWAKVCEVNRDFNLAEEAYRRVLELHPDPKLAFLTNLGLGYAYLQQAKYPEAAAALQRALEFRPTSARIFGTLAICYEAMGQSELATGYYHKAGVSRYWMHSPSLRANYPRIRDLVLSRGIVMVGVQYPMLPVEPLRELLGEENGVYFVDNEAVFKDAVSRDGYETYFTDYFAGEFGHCTHRGNYLLAENIAEELTRKVFNAGSWQLDD